MKIAIVSGGFVGLTSACVLAESGYNILLIEDNKDMLFQIKEGNPPFFEVGLQELLDKGLKSKMVSPIDWQSVLKTDAEIGVVCVGTPSKNDGSLDLQYVEEAVFQLAEKLEDEALIVIKSTVLPGTSRALQEKLRTRGLSQRIAMVPEFLREGTAVADATHPDRVVIGVTDEQDRSLLARAFKSPGTEIVFTTPYNAESVKYFTNAFLATCISFTNEMFSLLNQDPECCYEEILSGWHADRRFQATDHGRVGLLSYLKPGFGFGGSCFPKDLRALNSALQSIHPTGNLISSVIMRNHSALTETSEWIAQSVKKSDSILLLGAAFKEATDDTRESPAIGLMNELQSKGFRVSWHDLHIGDMDLETDATRVIDLSDQKFEHIVLCNNEPFYFEYLKSLHDIKLRSMISVYAIRYQEQIEGYRWLTPRKGSNAEF